MNDRNFTERLVRLERALAALAAIASRAGASDIRETAFSSWVDETCETRQEDRIAALERQVATLSRTISLLDRQIASLGAVLEQRILDTGPPTETDQATVDHAQDDRLDGLESMITALSENVLEYNRHMASLIARTERGRPIVKQPANAHAEEAGWPWP